MDTVTVKMLRTITVGEVEYTAGETYLIPQELAMTFVVRENCAEWHTPRRYVPSNAEFLSQFDPAHLRGRELA